MNRFNKLDTYVLSAIQKTLASKGYDFTIDQIYDQIKKTSELNARFNQTQHSLNHLWTMYGSDPPMPPYNYYFETQDEAISFANRAKKKYDVNCEIDLVNFRKWKLTAKAKKKKKVF